MFWIFRSHVSSNAAFLFKLISTFELHIKDGFLHVKVHLQWKIQLDDTRNLSSLDLYDWLELFFFNCVSTFKLFTYKNRNIVLEHSKWNQVFIEIFITPLSTKLNLLHFDMLELDT